MMPSFCFEKGKLHTKASSRAYGKTLEVQVKTIDSADVPATFPRVEEKYESCSSANIENCFTHSLKTKFQNLSECVGYNKKKDFAVGGAWHSWTHCKRKHSKFDLYIHLCGNYDVSERFCLYKFVRDVAKGSDVKQKSGIEDNEDSKQTHCKFALRRNALTLGRSVLNIYGHLFEEASKALLRVREISTLKEQLLWIKQFSAAIFW